MDQVVYTDEDGYHSILELYDYYRFPAVCYDDAVEMWDSWPKSARRSWTMMHSVVCWPFLKGEPHVIDLKECTRLVRSIEDTNERTASQKDIMTLCRSLRLSDRRHMQLTYKYIGANAFAQPPSDTDFNTMCKMVAKWYYYLGIEMSAVMTQEKTQNLSPMEQFDHFMAYRIFIDRTADDYAGSHGCS